MILLGTSLGVLRLFGESFLPANTQRRKVKKSLE